MSTTSDSSCTVFSSVLSALYAGITTAIRFPLIIVQTPWQLGARVRADSLFLVSISLYRLLLPSRRATLAQASHPARPARPPGPDSIGLTLNSLRLPCLEPIRL